MHAAQPLLTVILGTLAGVFLLLVLLNPIARLTAAGGLIMTVVTLLNVLDNRHTVMIWDTPVLAALAAVCLYPLRRKLRFMQGRRA